MNECDNWEKRKKMLEENGWHPSATHDGFYFKYKNGENGYVDKKSFINMSDNDFLEFIEHYHLPKTDAINHPAYYTDGKIEVSDFIADKNLNFFRGNVVKYVTRAGKKDPSKEVEDLKKAQWYINREIERVEGKA